MSTNTSGAATRERPFFMSMTQADAPYRVGLPLFTHCNRVLKRAREMAAAVRVFPTAVVAQDFACRFAVEVCAPVVQDF